MSKLVVVALVIGFTMGSVVTLTLQRLATGCHPRCWIERVESPDRTWVDSACLWDCG